MFAAVSRSRIGSGELSGAGSWRFPECEYLDLLGSVRDGWSGKPKGRRNCTKKMQKKSRVWRFFVAPEGERTALTGVA